MRQHTKYYNILYGFLNVINMFLKICIEWDTMFIDLKIYI